MQVKKYEAETLQEALDTIKRELGPDAVILQTRKNKKGFGILSKGSVEVTAAISDTSTQKKRIAEAYLKDQQREAFRSSPAEKQREFLDEVMEKRQRLSPDRVDLSRSTKLPQNFSTQSPNYANYQNQPSVNSNASMQNRQQAPSTSKMSEQFSGQFSGQSTSRPSTQSTEVPILRRQIGELETQLGTLRRQLEEVRKEVTQEFKTDAEEQVYQLLQLQGVDRKIAIELVKKAQFELSEENQGEEGAQKVDALIDGLANEILNDVQVISNIWSENKDEKIHWITGCVGSGKSSVILKLANQLKKDGKKIGLVYLLDGDQLDASGAGLIDTQWATQARILEIPVRIVKNVEEWKQVLSDFSTLDNILVDANTDLQNQTKHLKDLSSIKPRIHVVISNLARENVGIAYLRGLQDYSVTSVIMTHLDHTTQHGSLLNVYRRGKVPYSYFSTGRRIPEDIEKATVERVAALVLDLKRT